VGGKVNGHQIKKSSGTKSKVSPEKETGQKFPECRLIGGKQLPRTREGMRKMRRALGRGFKP